MDAVSPAQASLPAVDVSLFSPTWGLCLMRRESDCVPISSTANEQGGDEPRAEDADVGQTASPLALEIPPQLSRLDDNPSRSANSLSSSFKSMRDPHRPKRRMSIDPAPVSQILQMASSSKANVFAQTVAIPQPSPYPQPSAYSQPAPLNRQPTPAGRPEVRCMARTRVPTPHGELFLHLYHNSHDTKERSGIRPDPALARRPAARVTRTQGDSEQDFE